MSDLALSPAHARAILEALLDGAHPFTGAPLGLDFLDDPRTREALAQALDAMAPASRQGKGWSAEEDARLAEGFRRGGALAVLAAAHGRSEGAVRSRLVRLGLLERPGPDGDARLLKDVEAGHLLPEAFDGRVVLRVAWVLTRELGGAAARERLAGILERLSPGGDAVAVAAQAVDRALAAAHPDDACFHDTLARAPGLLDGGGA